MYPRIVIIDDMQMSADLLQGICTEAGFTNIVCYTDPILALEEIKCQGKPDLIITDNNMPRMRGAEVLKRLEACFGAINAIVVTAEPWTVEFTGKEYPILEKGINFSQRLLEFLKRNLKTG